MKNLLILIAIVLTLGASRLARANYLGYPCLLNINPATTSGFYGNSGWANISIYSGPGCSGTFQGYPTLCSAGAGSCGGAVFSELLFNTIVQNLQQALVSGSQRILVGINTNYGNVVSYLYFYPTGY